MKTLLIGNTTCHAAQRLQEEFEARGLRLDLLPVSGFSFGVEQGQVFILDKQGNNLLAYDVYIFRGMGTSISELSVVARYLKSIGKTIVEDVLASRSMHVDKFAPTMVDDGIPTLDYELLFKEKTERLKQHELPVVVKGLYGSMGNKVRLAQTQEELLEYVATIGFPLLLQRYVPVEYDYRVMVVDGEPLGAMRRYNTNGDFLTIRAGGKREAADLPHEALDVAVRAAKVAGLCVAGVDLLEHEGAYYRLEVNMSPQFRIFERKTEVNVAEKIVESIMRQFAEHSKQA